jgi:hypothetical protein
MKKMLAAMLSAVLLFGLALPASAASSGDTLDARLAAVTLKVKQRLNIGDEYTDFHGDLANEGSRPMWQLNWYMEDKELSVRAGEDGTIYSLNLYDYNETDGYEPGYAPHFPRLSRAEAQKELEKLIAPILGKNESVRFETSEDAARDADSYSFSGTLCVNSVATPFSVSARLRLSDLCLMSFNRSDSFTVVKGGYPSASPKISQADALALLRGVYSSKLEYACYDGSNARLVYLFSRDDDYLVNAATGKLFTRSELYGGGMRYVSAENSSAADAAGPEAIGAMKGALTDTELKGIAKLEGALGADELDAIIRAEKLLGVTSDYELKRADYSLLIETDDIEATVSYYLALTASNCASVGLSVLEFNKLVEQGYKPGVYKNYTLDGKTGELISGYTSYRGISYDGENPEKSASELSSAVNAWLGAKIAHFPEMKLYESSRTSFGVERDNYTFAQHINGYFFPGNCIMLSTNSASGCIDDFSFCWNEEVSFEAPPASPVSAEKALDIYIASFNELLKYELDRSEAPSDVYIWAEEGKALLTWQLESGSSTVIAVYAADGSLASYENIHGGSEKPAYTDLGSEPEHAKIEKLAQYGIGFPGGEFKASQTLTEKEMLAFFLSAVGFTFSADMEQQELDNLYSSARSYGLYDGPRHPDKAVTRTDAVRSLVSALGYSEIASLTGIYAVPFSDAGEIGEANLGYVALAKGLGIVSGDAKGTFRPNSALTRREAAVMLYNLMSR